MIKIIFICNELLDEVLQAELRLPLKFITFAHIDGKMYKHYKNMGVFAVPNIHTNKWGNTKVYGALFVCNDIEFYIDILDAYHVCSKNKLYKNHIKDIQHRVTVDATPIHFSNLDELSRLKYKEGESIEVITYYGNINHPKIKRRFNRHPSYRIESGVYKEGFIKLFRRVMNE